MSTDGRSPREALVRMTNGFEVSQAIHVAATLGIADLLKDGPRSVGDLAEKAGADVSALRRLLRALASVGVFTEADGSFGQTPLSEYLRSDAPGSLRAWAIHIGQPYFWTTWDQLLHSVKSGGPAFPKIHGISAWEYRATHPEANAIFNAAMTGLSAGVVETVVPSYDFSGMSVVVDVGGGEGALLAAILAANPNLRGILFDEPHVVAGARDLLRRAGVAARCEVVGGSFFETVPGGADAYILKSIVHDWDDASATAILRTCRAAAQGSCKLLLVEHVLQAGNEPDPSKFQDLTMPVMLGGRERTADEFRQLCADAGFHLTSMITTRSSFCIVEAVAA